MVTGKLSLTIAERILIHLSEYHQYRDSWEVPFAVTQDGVASAVRILRPNLPLNMRKLIEKDGFVEEKVAHVEGILRKRKVYFLTDRGYLQTCALKGKLERVMVTVRTTDNRLEKVQLGNIDEHVKPKQRLLDILYGLDANGILDIKKFQLAAKIEPPQMVEGKKQDFRSKFVGRGDELSVLRKHFDSAKEGNGGLVFIVGETGIGKTRLMTEFGKYVQSRGHQFLTGRCLYPEGMPPYLPFVEALEGYFLTLKPGEKKRYAEFNLPMSGAIGTELPHPKRYAPGAELSADITKLFESLSRRIVAVAEEKPTVLFFDDIHWADNATLQLLHYVSRNIKNSKLLLCCAYRSEELATNPALVSTLQRLKREGLGDAIELKTLNVSDTKDMITSFLKTDAVPADFAEILREETDGNPLFIEEILRSLSDEGLVSPAKNIWLMTTDKLKVPTIIRDVIQTRLSKLDKRTLNVLEYGAVIGQDFELEVLQKAVELSEEEIAECVDEMVKAGIACEDPLNPARYLFRHVKMQEVLCDSLTSARKQLLHKKVGYAIEELNRPELDSVVYQLARHFTSGGVLDKAILYLVRAAEKAISVFANEEAVGYYEKAVGLMERGLRPNLNEQKINVLEVLGDLYGFIGQYEKSITSYEKGIELIETDFPRQAELHGKIGDKYLLLGRYNDALRSLETGLKLLETRPAPVVSGKIYGSIGAAYLRKGEYKKAISYNNKYINSCLESGDTEETARAYRLRGNIYLQTARFDRALAYYKKSLGLSRKAGNDKEVASILNNMGVVYARKGELKRALGPLQEALRLSEKLGDILSIADVSTNMGNIYAIKGDANNALRCYERNLKISERIGNPFGIASSYNNIGNIYFDKRDYELALKNYREGLVISKQMGDAECEARSYYSLGIAYLKLNEGKKAVESFNNSMRLCTKLGLDDLKADNYCSLSEYHIEKDNMQKATFFCNKSMNLAKKLNIKNVLARSFKLQGIMARKNRTWTLGDKYFKESIEIYYRIGVEKEIGDVHYEHALMWKERGDDDSASKHLKMALKIFEKCGQVKDIDRIKQLLRC